jgi:hypothetical protein
MATKKQLFQFPANILSSTWNRRDAGSYNQQVQSSIFRRDVSSAAILERLLKKLRFDDSIGGIGLLEAFPELKLPAGSRLLEDASVTDLHSLHMLQVPAQLTFFNSKGDHGLNFICPLFSIPGFSIESLSLDMMHIMDLGVTQYLVGTVFRKVVTSNFARSRALRANRRKHDNMLHLRRRMKAFYKSQPGKKSTYINKISFAQLGTDKRPRLKAKAAETRHLVPLAQQLATENHRFLGAKAPYLKAACDELANFYKLVQSSAERTMSADTIEMVQLAMTRFLTYWRGAGGHFVVKHHMSWHLVERMCEHGNPRFYWTYPDENENRIMSTVAKTLHGGDTFYLTFLQKALLKV